MLQLRRLDRLHFGAQGLGGFGPGGCGGGVGFGEVFFEELVVEAVEGELETVGDAELVVDLAQVVLDDLFGGADLVGDLFVAHAAGDAADDGELFFGELGLDFGVSEGGGLGAIGFDDPADGLIVDPGLAFGDLSDAFDEKVGRDGAGDDATDTATVELDGVGLVGFSDLDDEFGIRGPSDEFGDGVDGAGDELAFEDDDVGGVALERGVEIGQGFDLGDDTDVVFEGEDLLDADAIDRLRVGEDDTDTRRYYRFFWSVLILLGRVEMDHRHNSGL
jgi:hypothetical protein